MPSPRVSVDLGWLFGVIKCDDVGTVVERPIGPRSGHVIIVDLRHWLLPNGSLVPRAKLAPHVALIVECATATQGSGLSTMLCRHHESRRRCPGQLAVTLDGEEIRWSCTHCDDAGTVCGWRGSRWDLSNAELLPEGEDYPVFIPLDELRAARDLELEPALRAVLASPAQVDGRTACVTLTETELVCMAHVIVNASAVGRARRRLDRSLGRIEQARLAVQLPRRARAH